MVVTAKHKASDGKVWLRCHLFDRGRSVRSLIMKIPTVRAIIADPEVVMTGRVRADGTLDLGAQLHHYGDDALRTDANARYEDNYNNLPIEN